MKFNINRHILVNALTKVSRAVSQKSPLPVLTGIKFDLTEKVLTLTGSDGDIIIQTTIDEGLEVMEPGSIVLSAKYILEIIRRIDSEEVFIGIMDGTLTRIEGAQSQFNLNGTAASDYVRVDLSKRGTHLTINAQILKNLIGETAFATSESESRPVLTGVNFKVKDQRLMCVATDAYRLAQAQDDMEQDTPFNIIIPKRALIEISNIIDGDYDIDVYVSDRKVLFFIKDYIISSRLIDGTFPDTSRLIPDHALYELTIPTVSLLGAIERTTLLSDEASSVVTLKMDQEKIIMTSSSQEIGSVEEDLSNALYKGDPLNISFSGKYLRQAVNALKAETVKMEFTGAMRPIIVKTTDSDDNIQVILPVRTY